MEGIYKDVMRVTLDWTERLQITDSLSGVGQSEGEIRCLDP